MSATKRQKTSTQHDVPVNLIAVKDVSKNYLNFLLNEAEEMRKLVKSKGGDERLKHKVLASVFYEVTLSIHQFIPLPKRTHYYYHFSDERQLECA